MSDKMVQSPQQGCGATVRGRDERRGSAAPWRRAALVALALTLGYATSARAQESDDCDSTTSCLTTVLGGVVDGFTGGAGEDLWGWMIGGGQSAGIDAISSELDTIETTLTTIATDLAAIQDELEELNCGFDIDFIAQYAGPIQSYYQTYANWLAGMQDGSLPAVDDVSEWANCAVGFPTSGQTCALASGDDLLTLMNELNDAATATAGHSGSISDCIKVNGPPSTDSVDDRPYYTASVVPITDWYLGINTQAMIVLTEAYHFRAWQTAGSPSSSSADAIYPNVCPTGSAPEGCVQPITVYNNEFLGFAKGQLRAGGAPYSTDEYLMVNGQDYVIARSIEQYNVAADSDNTAGCSTTEPGMLTSAPGDVCGATVGKYNDPFTSVAYGTYGYGANGHGTWAAAPNVGTLGSILGVEYNQSSTPGNSSPSPFLCTMSLSGGDPSTCMQAPAGSGAQANGGAGLFYGRKIVVFPDLATNSFTDTNWLGPQIVFLDAGIERKTVGQPNTAGSWYIGVTCDKCGCAGNGNNTRAQQPGWYTEEIDPNWYVAWICLPTGFEAVGNGWTTAPAYDPSATYAQYRWPALDWTLLTCSNGKPANDSSNLNPAGVPSLCGEDFDTWFWTVVPPLPEQ